MLAEWGYEPMKSNPVGKNGWLIQTYHDEKEAEEIFGFEQAGWYDYELLDSEYEAHVTCEYLSKDGIKCRYRHVTNYEFTDYSGNPTPKLSRAQKDALVDMLQGKQLRISGESFDEFIINGYVQLDQWQDEYELTELGKEIAQSEYKLKEQKKTKTRATARAKYGAMSGLGLKKTKYGGWE